MGPGSHWNELHVVLKSSRSLGCWSIPSRLRGVLGWEFRRLSPVFSLEFWLWLHSVLRPLGDVG